MFRKYLAMLRANWQGTLDLKSSSLIVQASSADRQSVLSTILDQIRNARGSSEGGITSSAASADPTRTSAIGAILNDDAA